MKSNSTLFILLNLQVSNKIEKELSQKYLLMVLNIVIYEGVCLPYAALRRFSQTVASRDIKRIVKELFD